MVSPSIVNLRIKTGNYSGVVAQLSNPNSRTVVIEAVNVQLLYGASMPDGFDVLSFNLAASTLAPGQSTAVVANISASQPGGVSFSVTVRAGNLSASVTGNLLVVPRVAQLSASPQNIRTQVARGGQVFVQLALTNVGDSDSGPLSVSLPNIDWLAVVSVPASLAQGDSGSLILSATPSANLSFGVLTGSLAVGFSGGSLSIPLNVAVVSDRIVTQLVVFVEDEYSYYAEGRPLVANATVTISTARGLSLTTTSNGSGIAVFNNITEATYQIVGYAKGHKGDAAVTLVSPEASQVALFLPLSVVSYEWSVTPTVVQDKYVFTLEAEFETYVPAPVVTITPSSLNLDQLAAGFLPHIDFVVTNWGLINVLTPSLSLPTNHPTVEFVFLEPFPNAIPANSSIVIPVDVRQRNGSLVRRAGGGGCYFAILVYQYICGKARSGSAPVFFVGAGGPCGSGSGGYGNGNGGAGGGYLVGTHALLFSFRFI